MKTIQEQAYQVLAEIDAALAICEATPVGPWDKSRYHFPDRSVVQRTNSEDNDAYPGLRMICGDIQHPSVAAFIASARTVCPTALRCLKTAIEGLLSESKLTPLTSAKVAAETLTTLINQWNSNK